MFANLKTKPKILMGSSAPLILTVALAGVAIWGISSINQTGKWVDHTHNVLAKANAIIASAVDMETGMRGYLLAGKEDFLDPYKSGEENVYRRISELQETVSDNPGQVARLGEVEKVLREWQQNVTGPAIALRREIGDAKTMNDMAKLVGEARGKTYFDTFRGQIATFIEREAKLLEQRDVDYRTAESAVRDSIESVLAYSGATATGNVQQTIAQNLRKMGESQGWVAHTYKVIDQANKILAAAVDMETGMRGYLLAGKEEFLDPYKNGKEDFARRVASLKETVSDNPAQMALLDEIKATIDGWQADVTESTIALRREIGDAKTMDDMADLIGEARGKVYFDKFRGLMADFKAEEEGLMEQRQAEAVATTNLSEQVITIGGISAVVIGLALAWIVGNGIAGPINSMTGAMKRLAGGDLTVDVPGTGRKDEIGDMASAVQVFKDNAVEVKRLEEEQAHAAKMAEEEKVRSMNDLADRFETSVGSIVQAVAGASTEVKSSADSLAYQADQSKAVANDVSSASQQAASNVQTVASAAEELSSSISEIGGQVTQSTTIANRAVDEAQRTNDMVQGLQEAAQRVGEVVNLINDIAEQTNLLALNATIEAARAGDAGKGFAVVASEVKNLANQTAKATDEISSQITEIQTATSDAVKAIGDITTIINDINGITAAVASAVEEQSAATQEIARNVDQAAHGTQQVNSSMGTAIQVAEETGNSAVGMQDAANDLSTQAERLKAQVEDFINQVRVA